MGVLPREEKQASLEGASYRSMRAVKGSLGHSPREGYGKLETHRWMLAVGGQ